MGLFGRKEKKARLKEEKAQERAQKQLEKELDIEHKVKNRKNAIEQVNAAREYFDASEEMIDYLYGTFKSELFSKDILQNGVLIATNSRVLFYGKTMVGHEMESLGYDKINSVDYSKGVVDGKITIYASGNKIEFETAMNHAAKDFIALIREKTSNAQSKTEAPVQKSPAEQLKEYKELLDMDIITQDEFDAKKQQLLGL